MCYMGGMAVSTRKVSAPPLKADNRGKGSLASGAVGRSTKPAEAPEIRIFVSYSHRDAAAQEKLQTHLAPWKRNDVSVWYDKNIEPPEHNLIPRLLASFGELTSLLPCSAQRILIATIVGTSSTSVRWIVAPASSCA